MKKQSIPELQKMPLEEVCLSILAGNLATECMSFLMQAPQPPSNDAISLALKVLEEVNAIEPISISSHPNHTSTGRREEIITPLGKHLAKLPVPIRLGKMLIFGVLFKVLDKTLTIAASLSSKSPFSFNFADSQEASTAHKAFAQSSSSDFATICNVWEAYCTACTVSASNGKKFCDQHYLNRTAFLEIKDTRNQFIHLLIQIGFIDSKNLLLNTRTGTCTRRDTDVDVASSCYNFNGNNENVLNAVICAGLYPNCAQILTNKKYNEDEISVYQRNEQLWFHKSSIFHNNKQKKLESEWIIFHDKFLTHRAYISTITIIRPFSLLFFGTNMEIQHILKKVVVDGWIELSIPAQTAVIFRELRKGMERELNQRISLLISNNGDCNYGGNSNTVIDGIAALLSQE